MWIALHRGFEPQPWHYIITQAQVYPKILKIHPFDLHWRNTLRVDPYAHPQYSKVLKHFAYICNDCEMQSKGVWRADQQTKQQEYPPKTDIS
jgi:hypothetical protein